MDPLTIAALIGGGVSLFGNLVSHHKAKQDGAREAARAQRVLDNQLLSANRDYIREYNTDALSRSDAAQIQRLATQQAQKALDEETARGAISGATAEMQAAKTATRGANYANMLSQIGAQGQRARDIALSRYDVSRARHAGQTSELATSLAQSHAVAADNSARSAVGAATSVANALLSAGTNAAQANVDPVAKVGGTIPPKFTNLSPDVLNTLQNPKNRL